MFRGRVQHKTKTLLTKTLRRVSTVKACGKLKFNQLKALTQLNYVFKTFCDLNFSYGYDKREKNKIKGKK